MDKTKVGLEERKAVVAHPMEYYPYNSKYITGGIKLEKLNSLIEGYVAAYERMNCLKLCAVGAATVLLLTVCLLQLSTRQNGSLVFRSSQQPDPDPPERAYESDGYLVVSSNGGLNQTRASICDMVAVARFLNTTLLVPESDRTSFWNDQRCAYPWWKEKEIDSEKKRKAAACPLTPEETTLVLRTLGIDPPTQVYIAAGDIYGGERSLAFLRLTFPRFDRYLRSKPTIIPEKRLVEYLVDQYRNGNLSWNEFAGAMETGHAGKIGSRSPRLEI